MKCEIIRDLLPSYADGLTSRASNEAVEEHLEQCIDCRKYYKEMCGSAFNALQNDSGRPERGRDIRVIRKFRRTKIRWIAISCAAVLVLVLLLSKAAGSWLELSYDDAGVIASVQLAETALTDAASFSDEEDARLAEEMTKEWQEKGDRYAVRVTQKDGAKSVQWVDFRFKTVEEGGGTKYLVFINCKNTLWEHLFARRTIKKGEAPVIENASGFEADGEEMAESETKTGTVPASAADAICYLDKGIEKIDEADAEEVEELIEKYGTVMWEKE